MPCSGQFFHALKIGGKSAFSRRFEVTRDISMRMLIRLQLVVFFPGASYFYFRSQLFVLFITYRRARTKKKKQASTTTLYLTKTRKAKVLYKSLNLFLKVGNKTIISMNVNVVSYSRT